MTKQKPIWDAVTPQPFKNEASVYTYVPRTAGAAKLGADKGTLPINTPAASYPYYLVPQSQFPYAYSMPQIPHWPSHVWYSHYSQPVAATVPIPRQYSKETSPLHHYDPAPQPNLAYHQPHLYYCAPAQTPLPAAPFDDGKRLPDGTRPWYGRTRDEVQEDSWKEREQYERKVRTEEKGMEESGQPGPVEAKAIEPKGKPTDLYWVQHKDGGLRAYPLGTIKNNFEGTWKIDSNGWPYLVEK